MIGSVDKSREGLLITLGSSFYIGMFTKLSLAWGLPCGDIPCQSVGKKKNFQLWWSFIRAFAPPDLSPEGPHLRYLKSGCSRSPF